MIIRIAAVVALLVAAVLAVDGGDISEYYDSNTFKCCRDHGWEFVVIRSYRSYGGVDSNAPRTLAQAKDGGITYRDVYHFPCRSVNALTQVKDDLDHVGAENFGMMWFDIETNDSPNCGWSSDKASNCAFMGELITAGRDLGIHMGIYASAYMWESIMGGCTVGADNGIALWYAHYDYTRSFGDFSPFGGWTKPNAKQYNDQVGICDINADADWYP